MDPQNRLKAATCILNEDETVVGFIQQACALSLGEI